MNKFIVKKKCYLTVIVEVVIERYKTEISLPKLLTLVGPFRNKTECIKI